MHYIFLMLVITVHVASGDVRTDYIISPVSIEPSELPAASAILVDLKSGAALYEKTPTNRCRGALRK